MFLALAVVGIVVDQSYVLDLEQSMHAQAINHTPNQPQPLVGSQCSNTKDSWKALAIKQDVTFIYIYIFGGVSMVHVELLFTLYYNAHCLFLVNGGGIGSIRLLLDLLP